MNRVSALSCGPGDLCHGGMSAIWLPLVSVLPLLFYYQSRLAAEQNGSRQISSNWLENYSCKLYALPFPILMRAERSPFLCSDHLPTGPEQRK